MWLNLISLVTVFGSFFFFFLKGVCNWCGNSLLSTKMLFTFHGKSRNTQIRVWSRSKKKCGIINSGCRSHAINPPIMLLFVVDNWSFHIKYSFFFGCYCMMNGKKFALKLFFWWFICIHFFFSSCLFFSRPFYIL